MREETQWGVIKWALYVAVACYFAIAIIDVWELVEVFAR